MVACAVFRYEMQDLHVDETLPQMVALSETYMQIYEQQQ
jgi:U4/U6.U5 tri-snRNP-associated protein 2